LADIVSDLAKRRRIAPGLDVAVRLDAALCETGERLDLNVRGLCPQAGENHEQQRSHSLSLSFAARDRRTAPSAPKREAARLLFAWLKDLPIAPSESHDSTALELGRQSVRRPRDAILTLHALDNSLDSEALRTQLSKSGLDKVVDLVERSVTHRSDRFAEPNAPQAEVEVGWRHTLALHEWHGLQESLEAAVQAWHRDGSEDALARICEIKGQLAQASEPPGHSRAVEPRD
jgi:DNA primase